MIDTKPQSSLASLLRAAAPETGGGDGCWNAVQLPCRQVDPELFFADRPDDVEYAKALCQTCPIRQSCLAGAQRRREPWGVWGGQLFESGVIVARKRPRGRPRKYPVPEPTAA
jgi:WhiB family redox-sensing transcriptional regulator